MDAIGFLISKNEVGHINESQKKLLQHPKLLIKDHKKLISKGKITTRLVIPETNFSATFATVGYLGLKNIGKEWNKLYKIHNCWSIKRKVRMGEFELEKVWSNNCINRCSSNVPFNKIYSGG